MSSSSRKARRAARSDSERDSCGTMDTLALMRGVLRKTNSVGKRVQRLLLTGKETPGMASRTELLPDDWSPQTMVCGGGNVVVDALQTELVDRVEERELVLGTEPV